MLGKKYSVKCAKHCFSYSREYRDQKEFRKKTRETIFPENGIVRRKMLGKKSSEKSAKQLFYIHKNIVIKKSWKKTGETIFPETHE